MKALTVGAAFENIGGKAPSAHAGNFVYKQSSDLREIEKKRGGLFFPLKESAYSTVEEPPGIWDMSD